ncbi:MAG: ribonucleoside-diphosphate reductase, adenosylcobalamin-dependent, partial [Patescibacteria group bacterium]
SKINGANLSLCISDTFMEAVENDKDWPLVFPDIKDSEYDQKWTGDLEAWKKLGKKVIVHKIVKARKLWDLVATAAWKSAEPGVVFMERYNKLHNNYYWNKIICVNPCGEEGLPAWGVCNLGSVNLSALVKGKNIDEKGRFDFSALKNIVRTAVRFQDNVVDMDPYVFEGIRKTQLEGERRIGLGTMGVGDTLIKLHIRYGSPESIEFIDKVYRIIRDEAYRASSEFAREKGSFAKYDQKLYLAGKFISQLTDDVKKSIKKNGIRNSVLLMQAPTGSTSLMAGTTSGIEPVYEFEFIRKDRIGTHIIRHDLYDAWYAKHENEVKAGKVKKPEWFVSANELTPEDHVKVQAAIQQHVDASISKTVNAPKTHTVEDVKKLYNLAYKLGCKGIAYMRDGSRPGVLERKPDPAEVTTDKEVKPLPTYTIKPRPMVVHGATYRINTPVGIAFITLNTNGGNPPEPLEIFINVGKAGSDVYAMAEGLGRMISVALRFSSHISVFDRVNEIITQLQGIGGARTMGFGKDRIRSLPDAVAKVLSMHYGLNGEIKTNGVVKEDPKLVTATTQPSLIQPAVAVARSTSFDICPSCGEVTLVHEEGCKKCYGCGYSEC